MKEIKLYNRDGADLKLISNNGVHWKLSVDEVHKYVLKYMRAGFSDKDNSIYFIDPSGGPFITVGQKIEDYIVEKIDIDSTDNKFIFILQ